MRSWRFVIGELGMARPKEVVYSIEYNRHISLSMEFGEGV